MGSRHRKRKTSGVRVAILVLAAALILAALGFAFHGVLESLEEITLTLNGDAEITLEYGEEYDEPGAKAIFYGALSNRDGIAIDVRVEGTVDTGKLGTYQLTYHASHNGISRTAERTVYVVDTTPPVITLQSDPDSFTLPGEEYVEEGYTALDSCDGDLTDAVQRRVEGDTVIYTVSDSSGNVAEAIRSIVYGDDTPPVITLTGEQEMTITAGTEFQEPGYTASDNVDGDVTSLVTVSGSVDSYSAGTYSITYTVTDSYGNTAQVTRTVTVEAVKQTEQVDPEGKVIYLTFDDGPGPYTEKLLSVLEKYNAKATFFVVNTGYISLLSEIAEAGHSIGIHSMSHQYATIYASVDAYFEDLYGMQDIIYQQTGIRTTLMRFPGGSSNRVSAKYCEGIMTQLVKDVTDQGFQYFDWNVDSNDAGGAKTADEVYNNVISGIGTKKTAVVLQHDIKEYSVNAVERIIQWGLANGYTFQALTSQSPGAHHSINN